MVHPTNYTDNPDENGAAVTGQLVFYGRENYSPLYDSRVFINTPLAADDDGNIYFGFQVAGPTPLGLESGIARIDAAGQATYVYASNIVGPGYKVATNSAPALSNDGGVLYVAFNGPNPGYLAALDSTTLGYVAATDLRDPRSGQAARLSNDATSSPMVGPDGDVYFGVLENPSFSSKGWMLHFSADLSEAKTPGAFGWDNTPSVVPRAMVPSYEGDSEYLLFTKYNNYASRGGDGRNRIAILDPNDTQVDERTQTEVMKEILTILNPTPDFEFPPPGWADARREWCINAAAVDPATNSVIVNAADGKLHR